MAIDILLLLALPASGKSELRRYVAHLAPEVARRDFHLGPTLQVDDYPYVHLMRRISREQRRLGLEPAFFAGDDTPFLHSGDWLTLSHLIAEDVAALGTVERHPGTAAALIDRLGAARARAGVRAAIATNPALEHGIAADAAALAAGLTVADPASLRDSTIVVEFARGGPAGAVAPLPLPLGYAASLAALGGEILERASILWVVADPAESRRRNRERAHPGPDGDASILHHGVPEAVMLHDYGMDDLAWLAETSPVPGTIAVDDGDVASLLPLARFDNRVDRTSFLRAEPGAWPRKAVARLHHDLAAAFTALVDAG
ncbi:MAG: hypothetical protein HZA58_06200 [Acidimicrobiia bacterium]|nr:hypothetical protein [Acidimicrobiia bacterium]